MDFLTAFPYWGILVIVLLNAWVVTRMKIRFMDHEENRSEDDPAKPNE